MYLSEWFLTWVGWTLFDLNFGILIPKVTGADDIRLFHPIILINVILKFISKAYAALLSRLQTV